MYSIYRCVYVRFVTYFEQIGVDGQSHGGDARPVTLTNESSTQYEHKNPYRGYKYCNIKDILYIEVNYYS